MRDIFANLLLSGLMKDLALDLAPTSLIYSTIYDGGWFVNVTRRSLVPEAGH